jgi:large subunit ribosomal protein L14
MIRLRSILDVVDNSKVYKARCFHIIGKKVGTIGSRRIASVKKYQSDGNWSRGDIVRGILVISKKEKQRKTGIVLKYEGNGMVVTNKKWEPLGTRVFTTVPKELRMLGHIKVIAIATIVV